MKREMILLGALLLACANVIPAQAQTKNAVKDWAEQWQMATEQLLASPKRCPPTNTAISPSKKWGPSASRSNTRPQR